MESKKENHNRLFVRTITYQICVMLTLGITGVIVNVSREQILLMILSGWIVGWTMYLVHEGIWNQINWQRGKDKDSKIRSITKIVTWRIITVATVFLCGILFNMTTSESTSYTVLFNIAIILVQYVHERVWNNFTWGKIKINIEKENI